MEPPKQGRFLLLNPTSLHLLSEDSPIPKTVVPSVIKLRSSGETSGGRNGSQRVPGSFQREVEDDPEDDCLGRGVIVCVSCVTAAVLRISCGLESHKSRLHLNEVVELTAQLLGACKKSLALPCNDRVQKFKPMHRFYCTDIGIIENHGRRNKSASWSCWGKPGGSFSWIFFPFLFISGPQRQRERVWHTPLLPF